MIQKIGMLDSHRKTTKNAEGIHALENQFANCNQNILIYCNQAPLRWCCAAPEVPTAVCIGGGEV